MHKLSVFRLRLAASVLLAIVILGLLAARGPGQEAAKDKKPSQVVTEPEKVVQEQLEAYNRHDLDAFLKTYSPEIKLYEFPDKELSTGLDAMRKGYGEFFKAEPNVKATIAKRIVQGDYIIDHEQITGASRNFNAVAIYLVKDGKITKVWFLE
jgi:hypothetical protein